MCLRFDHNQRPIQNMANATTAFSFRGRARNLHGLLTAIFVNSCDLVHITGRIQRNQWFDNA
jgi:hypothetical protein